MLKIIKKYDFFLQDVISYLEILVYTISIIIISSSVFKSSYIYITEIQNPEKAYNDTKLKLGESILLALSFLLCIEILKLFYIKSYKQLVIVGTLVLLKLLITYFIGFENIFLKDIQKNIKK